MRPVAKTFPSLICFSLFLSRYLVKFEILIFTAVLLVYLDKLLFIGPAYNFCILFFSNYFHYFAPRSGIEK